MLDKRRTKTKKKLSVPRQNGTGSFSNLAEVL